jgi:hypothetical protein
VYIKNRMKNRKINYLYNINYNINNINFVLYYLFIYKLLLIYTYIIIYITKSLTYNKLIYTNIKKKQTYYIFNIIKSIKCLQNIKIEINYLFNNKINNLFNKVNIINNKIKYSRIRSQYRLKKKIKKLNKEKKYNMFRRIVRYQHYISFVGKTPKFISDINVNTIYNQICLKINDTLNIYLNNIIYYIHNYNELYFNRIDSPKLLSDYIKILMKYEEKNPTILKNIVSVHSSQSKKSKYLTRRYIRKSHILVNKINLKLKYNNYNYNVCKKKIKNNKNIQIYVTKKHNNYIKKELFRVKYKHKVKYNNLKIDSNNIGKLSIYKKKNIKKPNIYLYNNNSNKLNNKLIYIYNLNKWLLNMKKLTYKKFPLIGMRIELSGPTKKGRRTQTHLYNEWVDFYRLPGKMQLVKIINDIKYWQSYGLTQRASIGIKVWMYFHTIRHSELRKNTIE